MLKMPALFLVCNFKPSASSYHYYIQIRRTPEPFNSLWQSGIVTPFLLKLSKAILNLLQGSTLFEL
ncbi:hypothetical protein BpHYR1_021429 [Brachionus plicatilis]|uniref:Uncharacterized protein n=1 Tax=Brachionus plicatilis TaxID=10195 RepID=A0A3M7PUJ2_BRAPC|nr:hypothetical protein BpHYR1_021429 [Brachionus plicatilis]